MQRGEATLRGVWPCPRSGFSGWGAWVPGAQASAVAATGPWSAGSVVGALGSIAAQHVGLPVLRSKPMSTALAGRFSTVAVREVLNVTCLFSEERKDRFLK